MLLVDDRETQAAEFDRILKQRVRAYYDMRGPRCDFGETRPFFLARQSAREPRHLDTEITEPRRELGVMLFAQNFGRCHYGDLVAVFDRLQRGQRGDHGLAAADVTLH